MQNVFAGPVDFKRSVLLGAALGVVAIAIFTSGFYFRDAVEAASGPAMAESEDAAGYPLLDEVQTLIDHNYLRPQPPAKEREYGAVRGMLASLNDRYTFFIEPPVAQSESD